VNGKCYPHLEGGMVSQPNQVQAGEGRCGSQKEGGGKRKRKVSPLGQWERNKQNKGQAALNEGEEVLPSAKKSPRKPQKKEKRKRPTAYVDHGVKNSERGEGTKKESRVSGDKSL